MAQRPTSVDVRLLATGLDWSWGCGAVARGRGIDLLLAACGRAAVLPRLEGPGGELLRERLDGTAGQIRRIPTRRPPDTATGDPGRLRKPRGTGSTGR